MLFHAAFLILLAACSSGGADSGGGGAVPAAGGTAITGTVTAPLGVVAKAPTSPLQWFASLFVSESYAQAINSFLAVANVQVIVFNIDNQGNPVPSGIAGLPDPILIAQTTTTVTGTYSLTLPAGFTPSVSTVIQASTTTTPVSILSGTSVLQAIVTGSTVNINPVTQVSAMVLVNYLTANPGTTLSGLFTSAEVAQLMAAIQVQVFANISLVGGSVSVTVTNVLTGLQTFISTAVGGIAGPGQDPPMILTTTLQPGTIGQPYSAQLLAIGGTSAYAWSTVPALALQAYGLALNSTTGVISGTPINSAAGVPITVQVAVGVGTDQQVLSLTINGGGGGGQPGNIPVSTAPEKQQDPQIISDGSGGAIIVWQDQRNFPPFNPDIYAQRVNSAGVPQWGSNGVPICTAVASQELPQLISDGAGGAIITWVDRRNDIGFNEDIYAQRVNAAGVTQWTDNGIPISTAQTPQTNPRLVTDGAGGALIVWEDNRNGSKDIYAQRVNNIGLVQWVADGVPIATNSGADGYPRLIEDGTGGAIIGWMGDIVVDQSRVRIQRVNSAGGIQWDASGVAITDFPLRFGTPRGIGGVPELIGDGAGGAVIAWAGEGDGGGIRAQRVNSSGVVQWAVNGVVLAMSDPGKQQLSSLKITSDGGNGAIISWAGLRNTANYDVYAQRVTSAGVVSWTTDGVAIGAGLGNQDSPKLIADGAGGAIIVWQDKRNSTEYDIYAQQVNSAGAVQWTANGVAISTAAYDQMLPVITTDSAGGAFIAWQDERNDPNNAICPACNYYLDIYAQRVNGAGILQ